MLDIDTCAAEARTLHPENGGGWFATLRKRPGTSPLQRLHRMESLDAVVKALDRAPDVYLSQASFVQARRLISTFKSVNCAFADIDCYSDKPGSPRVAPDDRFVRLLLDEARAAGFPEPSYVTFSGQGVYCKWIFDRPISAHQLLRWQELQSVLVRSLRHMGADIRARDAARVLRVMGSAHGETNKIVRVAVNNNTRHSFEALCRAAASVDPSRLVASATEISDAAGESGATAVRRSGRIKRADTGLLLDSSGNARVLQDYATAHEPILLKLGTRDHLNWNRFIDLRTLAQMRGGIHVGSRDLMMFWIADFLAHAGIVNSDNLEGEVRQLMGAFDGPDFDPIADGSLTTLAERLRRREAGERVNFGGGSYDPLYTPTNDHLIDILEITREEQAALATIIDGEEKLRRADLKVPGRADRRVARIEWRACARELAAEAQARGENRYVARIAKEVGIDRRQVLRLLAGQLDPIPGRVETRGRKKRANASAAGVWKYASGFATRIDRRQTSDQPLIASADILATRAIAKAMQPAMAPQGQGVCLPPQSCQIVPDQAREIEATLARLALAKANAFAGLRAPAPTATTSATQSGQPATKPIQIAPTTARPADLSPACGTDQEKGASHRLAPISHKGVIVSISRQRETGESQAFIEKESEGVRGAASGGSSFGKPGGTDPCNWRQMLRPPAGKETAARSVGGKAAATGSSSAPSKKEKFVQLLRTLPIPTDREIVMQTEFAAYADDPKRLFEATTAFLKSRADGTAPLDAQARDAADQANERERTATRKKLDQIRVRHGLCANEQVRPHGNGPALSTTDGQAPHAAARQEARTSCSTHQAQPGSQDAEEALMPRCAWTIDMFDPANALEIACAA